MVLTLVASRINFSQRGRMKTFQTTPSRLLSNGRSVVVQAVQVGASSSMLMKSRSNSFVKKGSCILTALPFAYVVKSSLNGRVCEACLFQKTSDTKLHRCSGCSYAYYCSKSCQTAGWVDHKQECANLRRVKPRIPPDSARLLARIILKLQKNGGCEEGKITEKRGRKFKDLMSHYNEVKLDSERMEQFQSIYCVLQEYLSDFSLPNVAECLAIFGRMCINSFSILDPEMQSLGTGIYLAPSIIDHSCRPNAVACFDGIRLYIRTLEDIPDFEWDKVYISYIELMTSTQQRQLELKRRYYFDCACARCTDQQLNDISYSAVCTKCPKPIPVKRLDLTAKCACGFEFTELEKFWEVADLSDDQLDNMGNQNYLDVCQLCLSKQERLHSLSLPKARMLDAALDCCINLQKWDVALTYGCELLPAYRLYCGTAHPLLGVLLLKLAKIRLLLSSANQALEYLEEAVEILKVTHGESHPWFKSDVLPMLVQARMEACSVK